MRTKERLLIISVALFSGLATVALATAANSVTPPPKPALSSQAHRPTDDICDPSSCSRVVKSLPGGPPSLVY